jgi:threonine/homoserine/homoserine lactone efflux protein
MISLATAVSFFVLAFAMALSPGPNLLYLASRSLCQGRAAGFASLAGVCSGMLVYLCATAAGLGALFNTVPLLYELVRDLGAIYLLWLAWRTLRARMPPAVSNAPTPVSGWRLYRQGFLTCLLNPKIVLTYGALLPQFVQTEQGSVAWQVVTLGGLQIGAASLAHGSVILAAAGVAQALRRQPRYLAIQRYLLAGLLSAVALQLAWRRAP